LMSGIVGLESIQKERERRLKARGTATPEGNGAALDRALAEVPGTELELRARAAYEYAASITYRHAGLTSAEYLAHPLRLMAMALGLVRPPDAEGVVLALLHNLFEVSSVSHEEIVTRFGRPIADAIRVLTVDRAQKNRAYTSGYYRAIREQPQWVRRNKVFDKLDNLFILCLNSDDAVRAAYLSEIEEFVLPIADTDLPWLTAYLRSLVTDCRNVGHLKAARP